MNEVKIEETVCNGVQITAGQHICGFMTFLTTSYSVMNLVIGYIVCYIVGLDAIM